MGLFSKPKKIKAPKADYAADLTKYVNAMNSAQGSILSAEKQYRPEYQALNLQDMNGFLNGTGGQQGLIGQTGAAQSAAQDQIESMRGRELGNMNANTGMVRGLLGNLSPEGAARVNQAQSAAQMAQGLAGSYQGASQGYIDAADTMGMEAFNRRGYLSQEQMRASDQQAREAAAASGRLGDNASIASQILNRENAMAGRRQEAMGATQNAMSQFNAQQQMMGSFRGEAQNANTNAYSMADSFYTQPGLQLLGMNPASMGMGQNYMQSGMGMIGQGNPKLYDTGAALNLGAAERQNLLGAQAANAQAQSSYSSGLLGGIGKLVGSAAGSIFGPAGTAVGAKLGSTVGSWMK
jgi:hypothetical protein